MGTSIFNLLSHPEKIAIKSCKTRNDARATSVTSSAQTRTYVPIGTGTTPAEKVKQAEQTLAEVRSLSPQKKLAHPKSGN